MTGEITGRFLDTDYDEACIHPEILPAVRALRNGGVETIASHPGIGLIGVEHAWGSYIQIRLFAEDGFEVARKISDFALDLTVRLQEELRNSQIALQLVSAEAWYQDRKTTSMESKIPLYRLQLVGQTNDSEILHAWNAVAQSFSSSVLQ